MSNWLLCIKLKVIWSIDLSRREEKIVNNLPFFLADYSSVRTLAARKQFDEPLDVSIRRKEAETTVRPFYDTPQQEGPINLEVVPKDNIPLNINNGEVTICRAPSPPQDEPMDFSTKKNTQTVRLPPYTSTKELRFAKNLKLIIVEIMRKHPKKGRTILSYLRYAWQKSKVSEEVKNVACNGQIPSYVQVSDGQGSNSGQSGSSGSSSGSSGSSGGSSGGGGGGSASSGGNGGHYGGSSGGLGGSSSSGNDGNGDGNNHRRNVNNNHKGSLLDMDLDFEELPQNQSQNATAKWFQDHPDINAGKILDGLLSLKTEFPPDENSNQGSSSSASSGNMEQPKQMGALDHTTANLLQMSVPDPSTTFLDIGTDMPSLYEDDPFNLEHLLPSNFNINQLDMLPNSPDTASAHFQNNNNQHILNAHGAEASMTITTKTLMMENNNVGQNLSIHHQPHSHHMGMNLYPETTISPMSGPPPPLGGHLRTLEPMQPMALKSVIKQEPLPYIKREDNNNGMMQPHPLHQHGHHQLLNEGYSLHTTSPLSSISSPGSPPSSHLEKNQVAMTIASLSSPRMGGHMMHPPQSPPEHHQGGGKMRASPHPSTSRKKPTAQAADVDPRNANQEDDELANIPSLQMRIKILQQRVSFGLSKFFV